MSTVIESRGGISRSRLWTGRIMSGLPLLFLLLDGLVKIVPPPMVVEMTGQLGYREGVIPFLGVLLTTITLIAILPPTSMLGTILLTGYLGGAIATHVRVGGEPFTLLFPFLLGALLWGGLALRDPQVSAALFRKKPAVERSPSEI